jgi:hypothetical protein
MAWVFLGNALDGEPFKIDGINVRERRWETVSDGIVEVIDPIYGETHRFQVFEIALPGRTIGFAAGEFSNGVWGFYRKAD